MPNILSVREFDTITCNEEYAGSSNYKYLDEKHFSELKIFIEECSTNSSDTDILEFARLGYKRSVGNTILFNNYVGIIELPSGFQIEILPKVTLDSEDACLTNTKRIFLTMLCCLKEFVGKSFRAASLNADRMNLYEIFINMYLKEVCSLIKHGIKSSYILCEDNLRFYKGKLNIGEHIKANVAHKERFYMQYDEYQVNRAENRLIKTTLLKLQKQTKSTENAKEIRQLLTSFELVDISVNIDKDFSEISLGRDTKDYEKLLDWSEVFLRNKSFTTFSGSKKGNALLFPMEKVFEEFVAHCVRRIFRDESHGIYKISSQDTGHYLFDNPRKFGLRPDIVVKKSNLPPVIIDTKWKRLNSNSSNNYGISQADMYQMYAYSKKYHTSDIWLIYPLNEDITNLGDIRFIAEQDEETRVIVRIFFIDLAHYKSSILDLYRKIECSEAVTV